MIVKIFTLNYVNKKIPLTNQKYYDKIIPIAHDKKRARKRKTNKKGNIGNVHYGK